jgi:hypothetical protein
MSQLFNQLDAAPGHSDLCEEIIKLLHLSHPMIFPKERTREVYERALKVLEENSEITNLKAFCLNVGRWHCGRVRASGHVTIYDE